MSKLICFEKVALPKLKPAYIAALLPTCVAINYAGSLIRQLLGVPLFLDAGGTILAAFIAGPWSGFLCAVLYACVSALTYGPLFITSFVPTGIIALIIGYAAKNGITKTWFGLILTLLVLQPPACLASAYIYTFIFGGFMGNALDIMHAAVMQATKSVLASSFLSELLTGLLDKTVLTIVLMLIFRALPPRFRAATPFSKAGDEDEVEPEAVG